MAHLSSSLLLLVAASAVMILTVAPQADARRHKPHRFSLHHQNLGSSLPFLGVQINGLCRSTDYPDVCVSAVSSSLLGPLSPATAIISTIRAIDLKAKAARGVSLQLAARATDKMTRENLKNCAEIYSDVSFNLAKSLANVRSRDRNVLNVNLSAVIDDFETCNDGFVENGTRSPLAAQNDAMRKMASNGLALAEKLK
ncbi:putative invertase inhibitor [Nymphaea thermarum]|nr:putative invertase inhibitor [Nymphaea thermarum]